MLSVRRAFFICILTLLFSSVWAAQLHFVMDGYVVPDASTWLPATPVPATTQLSFVIDTQSYNSLVIEPFQPGGGAAPCVGYFNATGLTVSNVVVSTNQGVLWTGASTSGSTGGPNATGLCPGGFFANMSFTDGDNQFGMSFDPSPGSHYDDVVASADPLLDILLGFNTFGPTSGSLTGNWGTLTGGYSIQSIQEVPIPSAVWLLGTALAGLGGRGRLRRNATV